MTDRAKILIVDDAEFNRALLSDMLSDDFEILEATNGLEALAQINRYHSELSLVLLDIVMPEMDGFEVLAALNRSGLIERLPVIIISAETAFSSVDHAYDLGAVEYINRPFDERTVKRRVKNTITLYSKQKHLENAVIEQMLEKEKSNLIMVEVLSHIVEFRNGESGLHVLHIRVATEMLLKQLAATSNHPELTPERIALIANASALHDIGKISISEDILNKPGRLTPEEYEAMKAHSAIGAQMLEGTSYYRDEELVQVARDICRWHHERYDGSGYPDGLRGDEIPLAAQVVSVADVYDALTNERVYKPAYSHEKAMEMIMGGECGAFDPELLRCLQEIGPFLEHELKTRSAGGVSKGEIRRAAHDLLRDGTVPSRTLALLEQERTKYRFFTDLSQEIQFEYVYHSDLLTLSEWGAQVLGLDPVIAHPLESEGLAAVLALGDLRDLEARIAAATPDSPLVVRDCRLTVQGGSRTFTAYVRPLWMEEDGGELIGAVGKFVDAGGPQPAVPGRG